MSRETVPGTQEPIYAVCPACLSIREDVLTEPCRKCKPGRFARVRFGSRLHAEAFVVRQKALKKKHGKLVVMK